MAILRYDCISTIPLDDGECRLSVVSSNPVHENGPYVVDDSNFVPMSEVVKQVTGSALSQQQIKNMYDFPDGRVTSGFRIPLDRQRGFTGDIAEASQAVRDSARGAEAELKQAYDQYQFEQKFNSVNGSSAQPPKE